MSNTESKPDRQVLYQSLIDDGIGGIFLTEIITHEFRFQPFHFNIRNSSHKIASEHHERMISCVYLTHRTTFLDADEQNGSVFMETISKMGHF